MTGYAYNPRACWIGSPASLCIPLTLRTVLSDLELLYILSRWSQATWRGYYSTMDEEDRDVGGAAMIVCFPCASVSSVFPNVQVVNELSARLCQSLVTYVTGFVRASPRMVVYHGIHVQSLPHSLRSKICSCYLPTSNCPVTVA